MPTFLPRMPVTFVAISISMPSVARRICSDDYWLGSAHAHAGAAALGRPMGASPLPRLLVLFPKSLDLHIHARGQIELHQRIHRLLRRLENIEQTLMRADLELLPRLFVHMRRTQHAVLVLHRGQRNRSRNLRAGAPRRFHNLARRLIQDAIVVSLQPDANSFFSNHVSLSLTPPGVSGRKEPAAGCKPR